MIYSIIYKNQELAKYEEIELIDQIKSINSLTPSREEKRVFFLVFYSKELTEDFFDKNNKIVFDLALYGTEKSFLLYSCEIVSIYNNNFISITGKLQQFDKISELIGPNFLDLNI